ncbi:rod-binding protein [Sulfurimonas sp.]|uniref:rod-binding protein n=1 Tax=Sulfurimonas sp. TaxID=2022749 RepID=UPI003D103149
MSYGLNTLQAQSQLITDNKAVPTINTNVENEALKKQTDAFEAIIVKMLMDNAMKDEKNLFSSQNDPGDKIYKSMYREELSKASAGSFGFSQMLYDYLSQKK